MGLAAIAAFTAAGISLVNVAITVRATSKANLQQWRRSEVRPVVARILALSDQATREQHQAARLNEERLRKSLLVPAPDEQLRELRAEENDHWKNCEDARQKMTFEVAQLRLVGQKPVRDAAAQLLDAQYRMELPFGEPHPPPASDPWRHFGAAVARVKEREDALIDATRADLGIYQG